MDGTPADVVPVINNLYAAGKAIYGMKVLGCGQLAHDTHTAIQYVLQLGTVHAITIGTSKPEHLDNNIGVVENLAPQHPLLG